MNYATFWQRFAAMWIDVFVFLPLGFLQIWLDSLSKTMAIILVVPMTAAYLAYVIYGHGRFGKTVGKHVMGIRVVRVDGERIGWREAWLRSSVDLVFALLGSIGMLMALTSISDPSYYEVEWVQRAQNIQALQPEWLSWTQTASTIWVWSEIVVMLFNERRRALHDFIAGTVVVSERASIPAESQPA